MKYGISLLVLLILASSVSAIGGSATQLFLRGLYDYIEPLILTLVIAVVIIILQYIGVDIIGISFAIITYTIDTFFNIVTQVTSREESLISAVILFIIVMAWSLGLLSFS